MKRPDVELPEEKRFRRQLERQHGDMLPGSFGVLEAISEQFKDSAPITVYWFLADDWDRDHPYIESEVEVALNWKERAEKTFNIPTEIRHELQPRKFRRLSAFVTEQRRRLFKNDLTLAASPSFWREYVKRSRFQPMTWEIKPSRTATRTVCSVRDIFFNVGHRKVYLLMEADDYDTLES